MKIYVYFSDWQSFWCEDNSINKFYEYCGRISQWQVEEANDGRVYKILLSEIKLPVEVFRTFITRPKHKFLGVFDSNDYPNIRSGEFIQRISTRNNKTYYSFVKFHSKNTKPYFSAEEANIILDALKINKNEITSEIFESKRKY